MQIDLGSGNKVSQRAKVYGSADVAVTDAMMIEAIQHNVKPTQDQVRKVILKSVSTLMLEIKFGRNNPPPAPKNGCDWINADDLLDQTAVAAGCTQSAPTDPSAT